MADKLRKLLFALETARCWSSSAGSLAGSCTLLKAT
jgi:hypothetical protein